MYRIYEDDIRLVAECEYPKIAGMLELLYTKNEINGTNYTYKMVYSEPLEDEGE